MTHASPPTPDVAGLLGPFALLGMAIEKPVAWMHARVASRGTRTLVVWYLVLAWFIAMPLRADFLGFDLIPLAGMLLANIREFYMEYQKQIILLKKTAQAYYYARAIDVDQLKRDVGELVALETVDGFRVLLNRTASDYAEAMIYDGQQREEGPAQPASHDGQAQVGLRFRVTSSDGEATYKTNSEIWNALFNPYDPEWDPAMTHETFLVLKMRYRWLSRELGKYRRAVRTYKQLAAHWKNLFLQDIEQASIQSAIRYAVSSSLQMDSLAAKLKSIREGPIQEFFQGRIEYWTTRYNDVHQELIRIDWAIAQMQEDMTWMERRALNQVAARIRLKSLKRWNYLLPVGKRKAPASRLKPVPHLHWSAFPKGWAA
ncbi:hypothetical protein SCOR_02350 [Sulfidibacter corallicola]|uniref:Uncharacterized protein n=1 Tax=Sulfidibacter corallicola TaxID=2818388 RepID=A0A8A4TPZ4_SULCO|nr:hypothetical protein [Sulfidibacter corallicola]QTD48635.1 hypothetical protein J3U87_23895 [Sulfidibacter corallicola]